MTTVDFSTQVDISILASAICNVIGFDDKDMLFAVQTGERYYKVQLPPLTTETIMGYCACRLHTPNKLTKRMTFISKETEIDYPFNDWKAPATKRTVIRIDIVKPAEHLKNLLEDALSTPPVIDDENLPF